MSTVRGWAPTEIPPSQLRPGRGRFWLAAGLAVAGVVGAVALLVWTVVDFERRIDGFERVPVPGEAVVEVTSAGGYTVYVEGPFVGSRQTARVPVSIEPAGGGPPLPMRTYVADVTYTVGSREGRALWSVEIPEPGRYRIATSGEPGGPATVAFGRGLGRGLPARIAAAMLVGGIGLTAGVVLAIVTGVARSRHRKALLAAGTGWPQAAAPPWSTASWPGQTAQGAAPPPPPPPPPPGSWPPPPS